MSEECIHAVVSKKSFPVCEQNTLSAVSDPSTFPRAVYAVKLISYIAFVHRLICDHTVFRRLVVLEDMELTVKNASGIHRCIPLWNSSFAIKCFLIFGCFEE